MIKELVQLNKNGRRTIAKSPSPSSCTTMYLLPKHGHYLRVHKKQKKKTTQLGFWHYLLTIVSNLTIKLRRNHLDAKFKKTMMKLYSKRVKPLWISIFFLSWIGYTFIDFRGIYACMIKRLLLESTNMRGRENVSEEKKITSYFLNKDHNVYKRPTLLKSIRSKNHSSCKITLV